MSISQRLEEAVRGEELTEVSVAGKAPVRVWLFVLGSKLTQYDQRVSKGEARKGRVNIYRLGHLLKAKQEIENSLKSIIDNDDPKSLNRLKVALDKHFSGLSPVNFVKKGIDKYLATGKLPTIAGKGGTALGGIRFEEVGLLERYRGGPRFSDFREIRAKKDGTACKGKHVVKKGDIIGWHRRYGAVCKACWEKWVEENREAEAMERGYMGSPW